MEIKELETSQGALQYRIVDGRAEITAYRGRDTELEIPDRIESCPVTGVGRKAFLSNKTIRQIALPDGLARIDDWAFAYCAKLTRIILPYHRMEIGRGIFKECDRLEQIVDRQGDRTAPQTVDTACLLAAVMNRLDAFYLFDFENVGTESWLTQWDARMKYLMALEDDEGFSQMLLCGEEDYGSRENHLDYYTQQRRKEKVRLAMLRLMHDYGLAEDTGETLRAYLSAHNKGQPTEETWLVVLEEHPDEQEYYQLLIDLGCVTEETFQGMMADMGENHTEMKAFLMRYYSGLSGQRDAFAAFAL